jgi:hypothetical protein
VFLASTLLPNIGAAHTAQINVAHGHACGHGGTGGAHRVKRGSLDSNDKVTIIRATSHRAGDEVAPAYLAEATRIMHLRPHRSWMHYPAAFFMRDLLRDARTAGPQTLTPRHQYAFPPDMVLCLRHTWRGRRHFPSGAFRTSSQTWHHLAPDTAEAMPQMIHSRTWSCSARIGSRVARPEIPEENTDVSKRAA